MKFGLYTYDAEMYGNLGDSIQMIALENIYANMGIKEKDKVKIPLRDIWKYDKGQIILPIVSSIGEEFFLPEGHVVPPNIKPIFISINTKCRISKGQAAYLKTFEPIGCRDRFSMEELQRHNVQAYVGGCITATLPKREEAPAEGRVFLVDVEERLRPYIPQSVACGAIEISQNIKEYGGKDQLSYTRDRLSMYKNEAKLIITPKVHCAMPCAASGIPVVLAKNHMDSRLGFIDNILPVYDGDKFETINWEPQHIDFEEHKRRIIRLITSRILGEKDVEGDMDYANAFYTAKRNTKIEESEYSYLKNIKKARDAYFSYSLYGAGNWCTIIKTKMREYYPNATLTHIYDKYQYGKCIEGIQIEPPENMRRTPAEFCVITIARDSLCAEVEGYFKSIGKKEESYAHAVVPQ